MKRSTLLIATAVLLLVCRDALAAKLLVNLAPDNLTANGFAVTATRRDDGNIRVTIRRDLTKARSFEAASDLELVRRATLHVAGAAESIVECNLQGEVANGSVTYRFTLAPEYLAHSRVTVSEIDDHKNRSDREHLLGGGTFFEIKLAEVVKR